MEEGWAWRDAVHASPPARRTPRKRTREPPKTLHPPTQAYFKAVAASKAAPASKRFGWLKKNEILNGRWVMFGVFVGGLTEYATGVDFVNQLKLMVSYLGIADIYD